MASANAPGCMGLIHDGDQANDQLHCNNCRWHAGSIGWWQSINILWPSPRDFEDGPPTTMNVAQTCTRYANCRLLNAAAPFARVCSSSMAGSTCRGCNTVTLQYTQHSLCCDTHIKHIDPVHFDLKPHLLVFCPTIIRAALHAQAVTHEQGKGFQLLLCGAFFPADIAAEVFCGHHGCAGQARGVLTSAGDIQRPQSTYAFTPNNNSCTHLR